MKYNYKSKHEVKLNQNQIKVIEMNNKENYDGVSWNLIEVLENGYKTLQCNFLCYN